VTWADLLLNLESKGSVKTALVARFPMLKERIHVNHVPLVSIKLNLAKVCALSVLLVLRARQVLMCVLFVLLDSIKIKRARQVVSRVQSENISQTSLVLFVKTVLLAATRQWNNKVTVRTAPWVSMLTLKASRNAETAMVGKSLMF
jgi:hypothetical protein